MVKWNLNKLGEALSPFIEREKSKAYVDE